MKRLPSTPENFWLRVARSDDPHECWPWIGTIAPTGYGKASAVALTGVNGTIGAHRVAYILAVGPIPAGLQIDHLCHDPATCRPLISNECPHRRCCNPYHLRAVTSKENNERSNCVTAGMAARTYCANGHPFIEDNIRPRSDCDGRVCRACAAAAQRRMRDRQRADPGAYGQCEIPGCTKPPLARGWCNAHYLRWRATGDPLGSYSQRILVSPR